MDANFNPDSHCDPHFNCQSDSYCKYHTAANDSFVNLDISKLNSQLRRLYMDQMKRKKEQERKKRLARRWGCICPCFD